jgi:hypothetical protein
MSLVSAYGGDCVPKKSSLMSEQVLAILAATPERIAALTGRLTTTQLHADPSPNEWSFNDILAHLRACADVWGSAMQTMLAEDHPTIRAINPRAWIKRTGYRDLDFRHSLEAFAAQRAGLLAMLEPLSPENWSRTATVTGAGAPLERTVLEYGDRFGRHERAHVTHLEQFVTTLR